MNSFQTEKKHLKDIHDMEVLNDDAPRIIQGLRNEIHSLKVSKGLLFTI